MNLADVVHCLLDAEANTMPISKAGWTALASAVAGGHDKSVQHLLDAGADPDQRDHTGGIILHDIIEDKQWDVKR